VDSSLNGLNRALMIARGSVRKQGAVRGHTLVFQAPIAQKESRPEAALIGLLVGLTDLVVKTSGHVRSKYIAALHERVAVVIAPFKDCVHRA
jgi:hypothetical protein